MTKEDWLLQPVSHENATISSHEISDSAWDSFVCKNAGAHYAQSSGWAKIKKTIGWKQARIVLSEQGQILAGVQLLSHSMPIFGNIQYSIKGPLNASGISKYDEEMLGLILQEGLRNGCRVSVIQPPANAAHLEHLLQKKGFQTSQLVPEHSASLTLNLEKSLDQILAGMRRQTRQDIRRGEQEGIQILEGKYEDLGTFYRLYQLTGSRQGFVPYPWLYIDTMWQVFQPQNNLTLLLSQYRGQIVSAMLLIRFVDTAFGYLLGWSGLYKESRPNNALVWGAIQWAQAHSYKIFDFGGINPEGAKAILSGNKLPDTIRNSPEYIKYGFGGEIKLSPPAYDYLPNPLFNLIYRPLMGTIGGYNPKSKLYRMLRKVLI